MASLRCPKCQGKIDFLSDETARCSIHGGNFQVLYARDISQFYSKPVKLESPPGKCARHPEVDLSVECAFCETALCKTCEMPMSEGKIACPDCATSRLGMGGNKSMAGTKCGQHPDIQAVNSCDVCKVGVCSTCDFAMAGGVHLCPTCATRPVERGLSSKQKKQLAGSYSLAALAVFFFFVGMVVAAGSNDEAGEAIAGLILSLGCMLPSLGGAALAASTWDRNKSTSFWQWGAVICNGLVAGGFILLSVVGTFMG